MATTPVSTQPQAPPHASRGRADLGRWLLLGLLLLALAGFTVTRALRVQDDIVSTVSLSERIAPGEEATIRFSTTISEQRADVLISDIDDGQVRALQLGMPLPAGPHSFTWDGTADDGQPVPRGEYGLRVILSDRGRDIKPPGRIEVVGPDGP